MKSLKEILSEMEAVLDRLIDNAQRLYELSKQAVIEDEVMTLQKTQNEMLTKLTKLDGQRAVQATSYEGFELLERERIDKKIDIFQDLNNRFIENLSTSQSLIHLENSKTKKHKK